MMGKGVPLFIVAIIALSGSGAFATEYTSTDFQVSDPVIVPGGRSTSDDFELVGVISQAAIGTSATDNFNLNAGFLTWPASAAVEASAAAATPSLGSGGPSGVLSRLGSLVSTFATTEEAIIMNADLNQDGHVGIEDFSILLSGIDSSRSISPKSLSVLLSRWTEPLLSFRPDNNGLSDSSQYSSSIARPIESGLRVQRSAEQTASLGELTARRMPAQAVHSAAVKNITPLNLFDSIKNFTANILGRVLNFFRRF